MRYQSNKDAPLFAKVSASTLLETIVASIIFMIIFAMAIDVMTRIMTAGHKDSEYLLIESSFNQCICEISNKEIKTGIENYTYEWGIIQVTITNYDETLFHIEMNAITNKKKEIGYQYIIANEKSIE